MKRYVVRLEAQERARLEPIVRTGRAAASRIRHANILLAVDVRMGHEATLRERVMAWNGDRNRRSRKIDGQFRTAEARIKPKKLYPQILME